MTYVMMVTLCLCCKLSVLTHAVKIKQKQRACYSAINNHTMSIDQERYNMTYGQEMKRSLMKLLPIAYSVWRNDLKMCSGY